MNKPYFFVLLILIAFSAENLFAKEQTSVKRFALIAAANDGGVGRIPLRYAVTDALSVAKVFQELGGLDNRDRSLLLEPTPNEIVDGLARLKVQLQAAKKLNQRTEVLFYYSGHSNENGLLLGNQVLSYKRLKNSLNELNVDVKLAILDSCASGAFTRIKGGRQRQAFLVDASSSVSGHAFLTSSSANENAQESDAIGGSYFTHYLVSALRGAGDVNNDKRITLNEAYQFAFHETLARTEKSQSGAQHAAYDIQLAGAGDLVLTDINNTNATLRLSANFEGRLYVRDLAGRLVVEMNKVTDQTIDIGLDATTYLLTLDNRGDLYRASVTLNNLQATTIFMSRFQPVDRVSSVAKGASSSTESVAIKHQTNVPGSLIEDEDPLIIPARIAILPNFSAPVKNAAGKKEVVNLDINLFAGSSPSIDGVAAGVYVTVVKGDVNGVQASGVVNVTKGDVNGVQAAGVANVVTGDVIDGVQAAGITNVTQGSVAGVQVAGITNVAKGSVDGVQVSGILNVTTGDVDGVQVSGIANIATGEVAGGQYSGILNVAQKSSAQIAAIFNKADDSKKVQISLFNFSKKHTGLQLGLVNVVDQLDGQAIGLISLVKNGRLDFGLGFDELEFSNFYLKTGTHSLYNILSFGVKPANDGDHIRVAWGLGTQFSWTQKHNMDLDITLSSRYLRNQDCLACIKNNGIVSIRALERYQVSKNFALTAGLSLNIMLYEQVNEDTGPLGGFTLSNAGDDRTRTLWPGLMLALEF